MYKQYTNQTTYNSDLAQLNSETQEHFQNCTFQDSMKHPIREEYYISFSRMDILNFLKYNSSTLVTESWLTTDIISELPTDFNWFDQTRNYRLICNTLKIMDHIVEQSELGILLINFVADFKDQIFRVGIETQIYLSELSPYQGITTDYLIATYPDVFLRIENK